MPAPERLSAFRLGFAAESRAAWLLRLKGYRILAARLRMAGGETDIVARRGSTLVFVEVKARDTLDAAIASLTPRQQRRIGNVARAWLARHPEDMAMTLRFDAIYVVPRRWPVHVASAFEVDI